MTYKIQIDDEVRDATAEEIEDIEAREAETVAKLESEKQDAAAKSALLERLGITVDEVALLLK